jgi:AGCS family alanine or glycine:cation symporter
LEQVASFFAAFSNFVWGTPLLVLLLGGGLFFLLYSGFVPFRYLKHAIDILRGKHDQPGAAGDITRYQALAGAIAATVGMGNISGVAVAITLGGPGALFWMWASAFVGMATNFFTCALAIMYRGKDKNGHPQGGPMYVVVEGLGKKWKPLAILFSIAGLFGCLPIFQANQLTQIIRDIILIPNGFTIHSEWVTEHIGEYAITNFLTGLAIIVIVSTVIFGGIKRIGKVAGQMVPFMVLLYVSVVLYIILTNLSAVPDSFLLILRDAFTGDAAVGGIVGEVIRHGARRAAFSNEAGLGTAPMMMGAAKSNEPIQEGLVAMLSPAIDTLIVCTMTALAIIITGVWQTHSDNGVSLTAQAFNMTIPYLGPYLLIICVLVFAFSTLFTYSYYGTKCITFLLGPQYQQHYNYFYVVSIIWGSVAQLQAVIDLIDGMYALMAIPTMVSGIILAPKVKKAAKVYFKKLEKVTAP